MKRLNILLVGTLAIALLSGSAQAQDNVKFGRGRLLKKWRDELTGKNDKPDPKKQAAKSKQDKTKQPTPAKRTAQPTPATRNQPQTARNQSRNYQRPSGSKMQLPSQFGAAQSKQAAYGRLPQTSRGGAATAGDARAESEALPAIPTVSSPASIKGFGMKVEALKDDLIVVTNVDPRGNAAKAGLKRGDQIVEFGGVKLSVIEEYNGIAGILGQGDELELKIKRKGSVKEIVLMFGERKETPATQVKLKDNDASSVTRQPSRGVTIGSGLSRSRATGDYDFVPPKDYQTSRGNQSVLEQSTRNRTSKSGKF